MMYNLINPLFLSSYSHCMDRPFFFFFLFLKERINPLLTSFPFYKISKDRLDLHRGGSSLDAQRVRMENHLMRVCTEECSERSSM